MSGPSLLKPVSVALLSLLLLSLPALASVAGGSAASSPLGQIVRAPAPTPPSSQHPGSPSLRLTWAAPETHAGVPIGLSIQALAASGQPDAGPAGTVLVILDDAEAEVSTAAGSAPLSAAPQTGGRQIALPLAGGTAQVSVRFATPGRRTALAILRGQATLAGESDALPVRSTFLRIQGTATATQGALLRLRLWPRTTGASR